MELHREPSLAERGFVSDGSLFTCLGFSEVQRLDYADYEAPDVLFDLNQPTTPEQLAHKFDVVLDSGTLEHIFDLPAALRNCARMVRPGGRIIHLSPASNSVDHGLYSLSPTLFMDFYSSCGYTVEEILLCRLPQRFECGRWQIFEYPLTGRHALPLGSLDRCIWFVWTVITASGTAHFESVQQSAYTATWEQSSSTRELQQSSPTRLIAGEPESSHAGRLLAIVRGQPHLTRCLRWVIRNWRSTRRMVQQLGREKLPFRHLGRI